MPKYKVTIEYGGQVSYDVWADNDEQAYDEARDRFYDAADLENNIQFSDTKEIDGTDETD